MRLWRRVVDRVRRLFGGAVHRTRRTTPVGLLLAAPTLRAPLLLPPVICLPDLTQRRPVVQGARDTALVSHQFYFRDTILDQLDEYMNYLRRMKRADLDAYRIYSKIGAGIHPIYHPERHRAGTSREMQELSPWFRETLPAFGAIACGVSPRIERTEDEEKCLWPRFVWFTKYERQSPKVQWTNLGQMYSCTVYWDKRSFPKLKHGAPQEFPLVVLPDGTVQVLRTLLNDRQVIRHRSGRESAVPHQRWGIFKDFIKWAEQHGENPQTFLAQQFIFAANTFQEINSGMIRVHARKGGITAHFGVDITRTPYFFADRELTVNQSGAKQRIFHVVRTHMRQNGSAVRMHFRGLRRFQWNGYDVQIMVPGREHIDLTEVDFGAWDEHWLPEMEGGGIYSTDMATRFAAALDAKPGDWRTQRQAILGNLPS